MQQVTFFLVTFGTLAGPWPDPGGTLDATKHIFLATSGDPGRTQAGPWIQHIIHPRAKVTWISFWNDFSEVGVHTWHQFRRTLQKIVSSFEKQLCTIRAAGPQYNVLCTIRRFPVQCGDSGSDGGRRLAGGRLCWRRVQPSPRYFTLLKF